MDIDYILNNEQDYPYIERFISIFKEYNWTSDYEPRKDKVLFIIGNNPNNIGIIRKSINLYHTVILFVGSLLEYTELKDELYDKNFFLLEKGLELEIFRNIDMIFDYVNDTKNI